MKKYTGQSIRSAVFFYSRHKKFIVWERVHGHISWVSDDVPGMTFQRNVIEFPNKWLGVGKVGKKFPVTYPSWIFWSRSRWYRNEMKIKNHYSFQLCRPVSPLIPCSFLKHSRWGERMKMHGFEGVAGPPRSLRSPSCYWASHLRLLLSAARWCLDWNENQPSPSPVK